MLITVPLAIACIAAVLLLLGAIVDDRRARARRRAVGRIELPLLHSINDDRCIGCEACVDACPTEVLELVDHKARVVRFSDCVQCEQCANACPTTALVMYRAGQVPRTITVPELDEQFQTGVPGQYLIGEVAGKPLVKNAANLGRAVIEHIARELSGKPAPAGVTDVVVVGSGPGGLSAGLTCLRRGLSVIVLEKEHVMASTVARYPKGKLFMAEPADAGNLSYLPVFDATKEELCAVWQHVVEGMQLPIKLGEAVEKVVRGDDGVFDVKTTVGRYKARTVVLATGLRGKPRLLTVPGANLEKVQSRLDDPAVFGGQHVLVVGGGDSAVEAAASLVDAGATVTLSYRGDGFKRCKQGNQARLVELTAANKLAVHLESNVEEFLADEVKIKLKDNSSIAIPNQRAFVLIGADTPVAWLEANNVRFIEREHLYALGSSEDVVRKVAHDAAECPKASDEALAVLRGAAAAPKPRPSRPRTEHSFIGSLRDKVREVTGVFRIGTLDEPPPRHARTGSFAARRTPHPQLIPAARLRRSESVKLFAHHDRVKPFTPADTTIEIKSLPALLHERGIEFESESTSVDARRLDHDTAPTEIVPGSAPSADPRRPLRRGPVPAEPSPPPPRRPTPAPSVPARHPSTIRRAGNRVGMEAGAHPAIAEPPPRVAPSPSTPPALPPRPPRGTPMRTALPPGIRPRAGSPPPPPLPPRAGSPTPAQPRARSPRPLTHAEHTSPVPAPPQPRLPRASSPPPFRKPDR